MNSSTALRARPRVVASAVLKQSPIFLALLGPPFIAYLMFAEWRLAGSMMGQIILLAGVSGITSTGLSLASNAETWPIPGHLLRGWVQWCGGFAIAFAGLALLSGSSGASLSMGNSSFARRRASIRWASRGSP